MLALAFALPSHAEDLMTPSLRGDGRDQVLPAHRFDDGLLVDGASSGSAFNPLRGGRPTSSSDAASVASQCQLSV